MQAEITEIFLYLAAVLVTGYGACTDLKYHKIYNKLTTPVILIGLMCNLFLNGFSGLLDSLLGILLGTLFIALWLLGMLKAGDVKLYMAVGSLAGWRFCGYTMIFSVLIGGLVSACLMAVRKDGLNAFKRLKRYLLHLYYSRQFCIYQPEEKSAYFSFGCCIFAGTLAALWYGWPVK